MTDQILFKLSTLFYAHINIEWKKPLLNQTHRQLTGQSNCCVNIQGHVKKVRSIQMHQQQTLCQKIN